MFRQESLQTFVYRIRRSEEVGGPSCAWAPADSVDRTRDGHGRNHVTGAVPDRRSDACDARLPFTCTLGPSAPAYFGENPLAEFRVGEHRALSLCIGPREQNLCAGACGHGQSRTDEDRVAQSCRWFHRGHAHAYGPLAAVDLHAFAGDFTKARKYGRCGIDQCVRCGGGEFGKPRAGSPQSVRIAGQQAVNLEADSEAVRGCSRKPGASAEIAERAGLLGHRVQNTHRFVENTDAAMLSHRSILSSRIVGSHHRVEFGYVDTE